MKLVWSPEAIADLISIRHYVEKDNVRASREIVLAITKLIEHQLPEYPNSGRKGRVGGTLELVVPGLPYIIPYRVTQKNIEIVRVFHTSRRWPDNF